MNITLEEILIIGSITAPLAIVSGVVINAIVQDETMNSDTADELKVDEMIFENLQSNVDL
jgi:hypothetical protein